MLDSAVSHHIFSLPYSRAAAPLQPLVSLDHIDQEPQITPESEHGVAEDASSDPENSNQKEQDSQDSLTTTAASTLHSLSEATDDRDSTKKQNGTASSDEEATRQEGLKDIVEGFRSLLWAELEKVNARYEAQERVASLNIERLSSSVWPSSRNFSLSFGQV